MPFLPSRVGLPLPKRTLSTAAATPSDAVPAPSSPEPEPTKYLGYTALTWSKILPLGLMFFCILFNYTILRDTKVEEREERRWERRYRMRDTKMEENRGEETGVVRRGRERRYRMRRTKVVLKRRGGTEGRWNTDAEH